MTTSTPVAPSLRDGIVLVGGGLASQRCAETLRRVGYDGPIRIVCGETHLPYDRPPLSKALLASEDAERPPFYRPHEWYAQHAVQLMLATHATRLVPEERRLWLSDGTALRYDRLLIATGSRPRQLPMLDRYANVSALRTLDDCTILRQVLAKRPRLAVIGAGFIGQEVASTARKLGAEVTMVEAAPCPLATVLGPAMGEWFAQLHRSHGVELVTGCEITAVDGNGTVERLRLSDGRDLDVDHVLVGVGVQPNVDWLRETGLATGAGVPADACGRTQYEHVLAAGDAAATFDPLLGSHVPGSHWEAAGRQGVRAARVMLGLDPGSPVLTSFWTDQYGIRIQYLGHARLADSMTIDGAPESLSFTATFTRAGKPVAALLVDRSRDLPSVRQSIEKGCP